jgi:hypothetical protein
MVIWREKMMWIIILIVLIFGLIIIYSKGMEVEKKNDELHNEKIKSIIEHHNFNVSKSFSSTDKKNNIYYDDNSKQILTISKEENDINKKAELYRKEREQTGVIKNINLQEFDYSYHTNLINPKDIIECGIFEDETSITKTSRGSQLGGALVGGVLAGGVGAVIGGLSGSKTSTGATKKIELRIIIDNPMNPLIRFRFLNEFSPLKKDSEKYEKAINYAIEWQNLVSVLIHRLEKEAK